MRHAGHVLIVPTLAPLVDQQWRWLRVGWLDPGRKEPSLVGLVPEVLVEVGVSDLLQWLHVIHRHKVAVQVHELNTALEEIKGEGREGGKQRISRGGSLGTIFALKKASASDRNVSRTANSQSWYLENLPFLTCQSRQQGYTCMYVRTYVCMTVVVCIWSCVSATPYSTAQCWAGPPPVPHPPP